jgi:hypothetical protein
LEREAMAERLQQTILHKSQFVLLHRNKKNTIIKTEKQNAVNIEPSTL